MKTVQFVETADNRTQLDVMVEIGSIQIRPLPTKHKEPIEKSGQPEHA